MARPSWRVRVTDERRDPIDYDLLAQFVLMLAAGRDSATDNDGNSGTSHPATTTRRTKPKPIPGQTSRRRP